MGIPQDGLEVQSYQDLFAKVGEFANDNKGKLLLFRGESDAERPLTTNLQRFFNKVNSRDYGDYGTHEELFALESKLVEYARKWKLDRGGRDSWGEIIANMQHYGIPTHFLDVTRDFNVATWFACENYRNDSDAVIYCFAVENSAIFADNLRDYKYRKNTSFALARQLNSELGIQDKASLASMTNHHQVPILVESRKPNDRMQAQKGLFLYGSPGEGEYNIKAFPSDNLPYTKLIIPQKLKSCILNSVEVFSGIHRSVLFPDWQEFNNQFLDQSGHNRVLAEDKLKEALREIQ
ncbi:hypothetical protein FACS1894125_5300 [Actinomycetota bacterium]|nr:hypothetical protein FACS1894125_5300 [Actinomycetota bacterium]